MINLLLLSQTGPIVIGGSPMEPSIATAIEDFFGKYRVRKYSKGQILIFNGDTTDSVFQLVSGRVKQYDITYRGDEIILNVFKTPAFFPMSIALNKTQNPYTFEAETDIEIREAPAEDVVTFLKLHPDVMFDLLSRVYRGVDGIIGRMAHLMASSAKGRLMFELLIASRRYGDKQSNGSCIVEMNETDLAARAGLSRETISREMRKLEKENLVSIKSGKVTIHDVEAFEKKLGKVM